MAGGVLTARDILDAHRKLRAEFDQPTIRTPFRPLATPEQDGFGVGFGEVPVRTDANLPRWETERRQFRVPRSRRGRIRKKWAKRARNWRVQPKRPLTPLIYQVLGQFWMHPQTWEDIRRHAAGYVRR